MTYYPGGKKYKGKDISKIIYDATTYIEENSNFKVYGYCEPFCGMMGVYRHIPNLFKNHLPKLKYKAGDKNPYIIKLWKGLQNGWKPPMECNEKEYYYMKENKNASLKSIFIGFACSFRGMFRNTFAPNYNIKKQSIDSINISKEIKNVKLQSGDYDIFSNLKGYIIYCDPPYKGTRSRYHYKDKYDTSFNYEKFIEWCYKMSKNNLIFISEYNKPCENSILLWSKGKEKLFIIL